MRIVDQLCGKILSSNFECLRSILTILAVVILVQFNKAERRKQSMVKYMKWSSDGPKNEEFYFRLTNK